MCRFEEKHDATVNRGQSEVLAKFFLAIFNRNQISIFSTVDSTAAGPFIPVTARFTDGRVSLLVYSERHRTVREFDLNETGGIHLSNSKFGWRPSLGRLPTAGLKEVKANEMNT
jgi:hypothetical protein